MRGFGKGRRPKMRTYFDLARENKALRERMELFAAVGSERADQHPAYRWVRDQAVDVLDGSSGEGKR